MNAHQSCPPYRFGGGSLPFDPSGVVFPHSRQRLYAYVRSTMFSQRCPNGHRQKHRQWEALTGRILEGLRGERYGLRPRECEAEASEDGQVLGACRRLARSGLIGPHAR